MAATDCDRCVTVDDGTRYYCDAHRAHPPIVVEDGAVVSLPDIIRAGVVVDPHVSVSGNDVTVTWRAG